jgi:hypothetical protein
VSSANLATPAVADDAADLKLFVTLSAALTGIAEGKLAPVVDPIQIRNEYFKQAKLDPAFANLIKVIRDDPTNPSDAAEKIMADPTLKFLGRSIILAWYLGAWYEPKTLAIYNSPKPGTFPVVPLKIISSAAYTQGWTWRVARAHPMGYSELRFGYWSEEPPSLDDYTRT